MTTKPHNPVPDAALDKHLAIVGITGSGKTVTAKTLVERLHSAGRRFCVVEPQGGWWGLRLMADGKRHGFPVTIFGGEHADMPITPESGEVIGELVATSSTSCIIDLSGMLASEHQRFVAGFTERVFHHNRLPLTLVVDEAHEWAPQKPMGEHLPKTLGRMQRIGAQGRSRGFRLILISQRPAKLNKDLLTQCAALVAHQLTAPHDRDAIASWIDGQAQDPKAGRAMIDALPTLKPGEAYVWCPDFGILERARFPMPRTYDSSATPKDGIGHATGELAPIDLAAVEAKLAQARADLAANDPKALKRKVGELQKQLNDALRTPVQVQAGDAEALRAENAELRGTIHRLRESMGRMGARLGRIRSAVLAETESIPEPEAACPPAHSSPTTGASANNSPSATASRAGSGRPVAVPARATSAWSSRTATASSRPDGTSGERLPVGEAAVLRALIQYPAGLRREQLTVLTGYKRSSRDAYIARLAGRGFAQVSGDRVLATREGAAAMPDAEPLPTGEALRQFWMERLPEGERRVLEVLVENYPATVERTEIDGPTGYKRSSRDAYLARLAAKELVETTRGGARASDTLFDVEGSR